MAFFAHSVGVDVEGEVARGSLSLVPLIPMSKVALLTFLTHRAGHFSKASLYEWKTNRAAHSFPATFVLWHAERTSQISNAVLVKVLVHRVRYCEQLAA